MCIGTIIGRISVLTAAHCLGMRWKSVSGNLLVVAGSRILIPSVSVDILIRRVVKQTLHPKYQTQQHKHDIAILTLEKAFDFKKFAITQASLQVQPIEDGSLCEFLGWGIDIYFGLNATNIPLKATTVRAYNTEWCRFIFQKSQLDEFQLCAQKPVMYPKPCSFDMGSPLVCNKAVVGVGAKRYNCDDIKKPHTFMMISKYHRFLLVLDEFVTFNCTISCHCKLVLLFLTSFVLLR
ncbi:serine protease 52-like isoform X2 [Hermetia illucens]|nr:serine protease 52-like isoform X2 [Hermetia illucens]